MAAYQGDRHVAIRVLAGKREELHELVRACPTSVRLRGPDGRLRRFRLRDGTSTGDERVLHPVDLARLASPELSNANVFGERLRQAREVAGVRQAALAAALGLSGRSNVSQYEVGKTQPSAALVEEVAHLLGVRPEWLVGWQDEELVRRLARAQAARAARMREDERGVTSRAYTAAEAEESEAVCALLDYLDLQAGERE